MHLPPDADDAPCERDRARRGTPLPMLILAFDASTSVTTVALARTEGDARQVLAGEELACVERVLAGVGPGTFTGIRIAATTARALALATGAALSKNSTLAALASPALSGGHPEVLAVLDARRGQVFSQRFSAAGPASHIYCERPEDLSAEGAPLIVGDGAVRYRYALSALGSIPPDDSPLHRVTATGHVLSADLAPVDADDLVPIYVREPDAEVRRDLNPWSRP